METRPNLDRHISVADFEAFYWLKAELVKFCKSAGLKTTGAKIDLAKRISHYLETGHKQLANPSPKSPPEIKSTFDWHSMPLSLQTKITNSYKNTQNVRRFFTQAIGKRFKFNVLFMRWMKANAGKTLAEAIDQWKKIDTEKKANTQAKDIAPQFEYNRYLRDFLTDNPTASRAVEHQKDHAR